MKTLFRSLVAIIASSGFTSAVPVGICLHAYSPEAPEEKIECFEFDRSEKIESGTRFFLPNGNSAIITDYRKRGVILYPDLQRTPVESLDSLLKGYERRALQTPASRRYLNPWIAKLRDNQNQITKQDEANAKLPTVNLPDGSSLSACSLMKIENGIVSVRHRDGIQKIPLKDLDSAQKGALAATTKEWSFDEPGITPKGTSGSYSRIVFKNGSLVENAQFSEFTDGKLVFAVGIKKFSISSDQFPGDLTMLGVEVGKPIEMQHSMPRPSQPISSSSGFNPSIQPAGIDFSSLGPINDGSSLLGKAKDAEASAKRLNISLEAEIAKHSEEMAKLETEFQKAGGKERLDQIRKDAGPFRRFVVMRALLDSGFENLGGGDNVYEVAFQDSGSTAIVVTPQDLPSGGRSGLYLTFRRSVEVTLKNGMADKREVYGEFQPDGGAEFKKLYEDYSRKTSKIDLARTSADTANERSEQAVAVLRYASERVAGIHMPRMIVSPGLAGRGWSASIQDRKLNSLVEALKRGALLEIAGTLEGFGINREKFEALENFSPSETKPIPTISEIEQVFSMLTKQPFRVEFLAKESVNYREWLSYIMVPSSFGSITKEGSGDLGATSTRASARDKGKKFDPFQGGFDLPGDPEARFRCESGSFSEKHRDANGRGYITEIPVFSYSAIALLSPETNAKGTNDSANKGPSPEKFLEQRERSLKQDFEAGRINADEKAKAVAAAQQEYLARLKEIISQH